MTLVLRTDRSLIRAGASSARYLVASYTAPEAPPAAERLPVNLAFVLDRSGSMDGEGKFVLAREAIEHGLAMLRDTDRFALVVYDDVAETLVPTRAATAEAKRDALNMLHLVEPRGSTDLCSGWLLGCEQVAPFLSDDRVTRVLLLTDGLANHGTTDPQTLAGHAGELRARGIATSTFGVGEDFDERLLDAMAHRGNGNSYFIQTASQLPVFLTSEVGEALTVVARGAALELELPNDASVIPLNRFRQDPEQHNGRLRIALGDLVSGQEIRAVVRLQFPKGEEGQHAVVQATLTGDGALMSAEHASIEWTYADHAANDRQPRDREVDRIVAGLYASRARAEATEANRHGDFDRARRVMMMTADRIAGYAGNDRELRALATGLRGEVSQFTEGVMSAMSQKVMYQSAHSMLKDRAEDGRARRGRR